jgi:hypothetical protein
MADNKKGFLMEASVQFHTPSFLLNGKDTQVSLDRKLNRPSASFAMMCAQKSIVPLIKLVIDSQ